MSFGAFNRKAIGPELYDGNSQSPKDTNHMNHLNKSIHRTEHFFEPFGHCIGEVIVPVNLPTRIISAATPQRTA